MKTVLHETSNMTLLTFVFIALLPFVGECSAS